MPDIDYSLLGAGAVVSADRERSLARLRSDTFDVLVIGGGITGAGIALDAVLRGLEVALVEKSDFAAGTSSASSKLIHGGLRYLEHGEFRLVREALNERHTLLQIAPHLVRPLQILVLDYTRASRPRWLVKLGLTLYDWLAGQERIGRHRRLDTNEVIALVPQLRTDGLRGGFEFFDAQMDDARLCLEVVLTALASGAACANYVEAVEMRHDRSSRVCGCEVRDCVTGESFAIAARSVVNAAGPWLDQIRRIDDGAAAPSLAPTKGVHIVLPDMKLKAGLLITHPEDHRVMFVLPWMNRTLVGTTDTFSNESPDEMAAAPGDTEYLLAAVNYYFGRSLVAADAIATIAGLRPLLSRKAKDPSAVSREFAVIRSRSGLWSIAGGKYTTYRSMAQNLVDRIVAGDGHFASAPASRTAQHRLVGSPREEWGQFRELEREHLANSYRLEPAIVQHLVDRYGVRARQIAAAHAESPELWQSIAPGDPDVWAELRFQSQHEMAVFRADHLLRRTRLGLFHPNLLV